MAGTLEGGLKAAATNLKNDPDFYKKIGRKGGAHCDPNKGFGGNRELARRAGAIGGRISKRGQSAA